MTEQARQPNIVQVRVEQKNLHNKRGQWMPLNQIDLHSFPYLTYEYFREFTYGIFQVQLSPSYIQDNNWDEREAEF